MTDIPDQTIDEDTSTGLLTFTVDDRETPVDLLTVSGGSSNTALVPDGNILFSGIEANRFVNVKPVADQFGTTTIDASSFQVITHGAPVSGRRVVSSTNRFSPACSGGTPWLGPPFFYQVQ